MSALDWRSAALSCTADPCFRRRIWHGGLLLMVPFVGWPLVLGYRRLLAERLIDGGSPLLPEWKGSFCNALRHGLSAMAVIHAWYGPLYVWLCLRMAELQLWPRLPWLPVLLFLTCFPIFSTLTVPAWLLWLRLGGAPMQQVELMLLGLLFVAITFCIPAGFLRVSRTRRTLSAFHLPASLRLIGASPLRYVEAWLGSGIMSLCAHFCLPLAPWGVLWCYLAIIYSFNEVPLREDARAFCNSWYPYFRREHWEHYDIRRSGLLETYELLSRGPWPLGRPAARIRALCLGPLRLLLPSSGGTRPG